MYPENQYRNCRWKYSFCLLNVWVGILLCISCMPEENLPIRNVGEPPEYFIECYCKPGKTFVLSATTVLPVSESLEIDFSKKMTIRILANHEIELFHTLYSLPGSEIVYNYAATEKMITYGLDSLKLWIMTSSQKQIDASTAVPPPVNIYRHSLEGNEAIIHFHISDIPEDNYYIYTAEIVRNGSVIGKQVCYLDYSEYPQTGLIEKSLFLSDLGQAEKIIFNLKRITRDNYDYQISLNAANTANQSSITTPVPLKGNLNGALGIFTCYTEDQKEIAISN